LEAAEDVLAEMPDLVRQIIRLLCSVQGSRFDAVSEEAPGKIMHELRRIVMNGAPIGAQQKVILAKLAAIWGGTRDEVLYFGSADATCLFARLICRYVQHYGADILFERVTVLHRPSEMKSVLSCLIDAVAWIEWEISRSELGLLEFCRSNRHGHRFQVWQDGATAYIHADGTLPNARMPIAEVALQGLAYDALALGAEVVKGMFPSMAKRWYGLARRVQQTLIDWFWLPQEQFFAPLIDRDTSGHPRHVLVLKASAGEVLDTTVLDSLPDDQRERVVRGVTCQLTSDEFMTDYGLRTRALRWHRLMPYADYQGSLVTWPKQSLDVARGYRRHGLVTEACSLERAILRLVRRSGCYLEFGYVGLDGQLGHTCPPGEKGDCQLIPGTNIPERNQAWTASAVHHIMSRHGHDCQEDGASMPSVFVDIPGGRAAEAAFMTRAA
jgi:glycogen debranching enzyme